MLYTKLNSNYTLYAVIIMNKKEKMEDVFVTL